jgi:5-methylcytosine-specific restriction endonuclease McrA
MNTQSNQHQNIYQQGLEDPRWKRLRLNIIDRDGHQCRICGQRTELQVHHRQYHKDQATGEWSKPWEYHPLFLITVCNSCHQNGHNQFPIPIKEI